MENAVLVAFAMRRADARTWVLENVNRLQVLIKLWTGLRTRSPGLAADVMLRQTLELLGSQDVAERAWLSAHSERLRALAVTFTDYHEIEDEIDAALSRGSLPSPRTPYEELAARLSEQTVAVLRKLWSRTVKYQNEEAFPGKKDAAVRGLADYYLDWYDGNLDTLAEDLETVGELGGDGLTVRQVRLLNQDRAEEVSDRSGTFRIRRTDR
ncbi:MAG: hypothetical protein U1A78_30820 [Polyangia bacterium]